jgi:parallel beta-helix repeat protein
MRAREKFAGIFVAAMAIVALVVAPGASAGGGRVIQVHPGQLQTKLAASADGDTLVVHRGHYRGAVQINSRIRLVGAKGEPRPLIDGLCATRATILVRNAGVVLRHLAVVGADEGHGEFPSEVDFSGLASGRAVDLSVRDSCDAEYGINVFGSEKVDLIGNRGRGFSDSVIYIGGIHSTGGGVLRVNDNEVFGSNRGIIIEDSAGGDLRFKDNRVHGNRIAGEGAPSGIFVHNSDGVLISGNTVNDNGQYGIHLDPNSDDNRLFDNTVRDNPGGNFRDEGTGNCGVGNHPNPFPPCA